MTDQTANAAAPGGVHQTPGRPTPERLMLLSFSFAAPPFLDAAIKNGVFDLLDNGPMTAEEVSNASGASERGVRALLGGLLAFEVVRRDGDGKYFLPADTSTFMVSTKPPFLGHLVRHLTEQLMANWMGLAEIVRTGKPARSVNREDGGSVFFEQFVESLFPVGYAAAQALAADLALDKTRPNGKALDLAAGSGVWGIALAQSAPNVTVTAVDWPNVLQITRRVADRSGVGGRFSYLPGDIQDVDFGSGYAVATLGHILHSEGETKSRGLLQKVYGALAPGGTIAISEFLVNAERTGPPLSLIFASNMLVNTDDGDTWSFEEIASWLGEAGFVNSRTLPAPGPSPLILADKPEG